MTSVKDPVKDHLAVLIVDDESVFRDRLCRALRERGWDAHTAANAEQALDLAKRISPDLVLLDLRMPETSGLNLIEDIKNLDSTIAVVILTGYGSIATAMQALKLGADHYLSKPADADQILAAFRDLNHQPTEKQTPP